jgi:phage host-nuclease inhibitor protein Gam
MAAKKKPAKKSKEPEVRIPKDRSDAAESVRLVGLLRDGISVIEDRLGKEVAVIQKRLAEIQQRLEEETLPLRTQMEILVDGLFIFFETNSPELTEDGARRSVDLGTGVIGERLNPWKAEIKKAEDVLEELKRMSLSQFIRTKEELSRDAMLATEESRKLASQVKGVSIVREEEFFVSPVDLMFANMDVTNLFLLSIFT